MAILGEIATPGAYCLDARSLSLQTLVRRAGGVTEEASTAIRLIRHERVNQTLFLSPQSDAPLLPGDVLIVESKRAMLGTSKVMNVGNPANGVRRVLTGTSDSQGVQVAYLNVLDRPVVVKLRNEEARLDHIVQMLGQPVELAGSVHVLGPDRIASEAQAATASSRLTDGTVLVFRKGSVNRNKLPATLPKPYDSEIATGAFPSLIGGALGQSSELRSVGQLAPLMLAPGQAAASSSAPFSEPVPSLQAQVPPLNVPTFNPDPPSLQSLPARSATQPSRSETLPSRVEAQPSQMPLPETPIVSSRPRVATLPFAGSAPMRSSSSRSPIEPEQNAPPPPETKPLRSQQDRDAGRSDSAPSHAALETLSNLKNSSRSPNSELTVNESGASPFSAAQMFGILAGVSALIGAALLARKHFDKRGLAENSSSPFPESPRVQQTPIERALAAAGSIAVRTSESNSVISEPELTSIEPAPSLNPLTSTLPEEISDLDQLIKNALPFREEASVFPTGINLQGRLAPRPVYRVDRAVENVLGSGPHFTASNSASETRSDRFETSAQFEPTAEQLELDTHPATEARLSGPHFGRRRSGAKSVAVGESASAAMPIAPASHQSTPLADALRQLQGDRPS